MAFVPLFCDSFDHYQTSDLSSKYTFPGAQSSIIQGSARTGTQSLYLGGTSGPGKAIGPQTAVIAGHAYLPPSLAGRIFIFYNTDTGEEEVDVNVAADGSIFFTGGNTHIPLGDPSAPGLLQAGIYCYLEYALAWIGGIVNLYARVNGQLVITVLNLPPGDGYINEIILSGPGGSAGAIHDDLYVGYSTTPATITDDFQGPVRIYPLIPIANETPLQWTPLSGTNFSEVNQIPPPGDAAYVADGTVGDVDQYQLDFISGHGPSGSYTIKFGQTVIDAKLDASGARLIAPDIGGNVGNSVALSTAYSMYEQTYSLNPVTGLPFAPADFTTTFLGPKVTG